MNIKLEDAISKYAYGLIIGLGALLYLPTLFYGYTYLDDHLIFESIYFFKDISNIFKSFFITIFHIQHTPDVYYRPINTVLSILEAQLGGASPFFGHLINILLHLIASSLVYKLLRALKYRLFPALFLSLCFVVQPAFVQAVVWIPGRVDVLLSVFILTSFIFFINYLNKKKLMFLLGHFIFFALALFTKELALLLPIFLLWYRILSKNKVTADKLVNIMAGWSFIFIIWFLLRHMAIQGPAGYSIPSILDSVVSHLPAVLLYFGKAILPVQLAVLPVLPDSSLLFGFISFAVLIILLLFSKQKRLGWVAFGIVWFLVFLIPSFIRPNPDEMFELLDHRLYLPMFGLLLLIMQIDWVKNLKLKYGPGIFFILAVILLFTGKNIVYRQSFKNRIVFWQKAVKGSPHYPLAHRNLGAMYFLDNRLNEAKQEFEAALALNPQEKMAHMNLGLIAVKNNDLKLAEEEYKKELAINPYYDKVHYNLALLYAQQEKYNQAVEWWQKTIKINPEYFQAHISLAVYYAQQKETEKAAWHIKEVLRRGGEVPNQLLQLISK